MAYARSEILAPNEVSTYHCVSRCVRRAFLCGEDSVSGHSFEHRRLWIRQRLSLLTEIFAIEVIAYAVMSNHLHSLIRIRPDISAKWSPEDIATRWRTLFPYRRKNGKPAKPNEEEISELIANPQLIQTYRERLCSVSWFNRCLNETIARMANAEDDCKGRFWEGRFACQRVLDIGAVLACATYIDLNPIRAGIAKTPETSDHTSIQDRVFKKTKRPKQAWKSWAKIPLVSIPELTRGDLNEEDYLKLVDLTGRAIVEGKANIPNKYQPILKRLGIEPTEWLTTTLDYKRKFFRMVGPAQLIQQAAHQANKACFHGISEARLSFHHQQPPGG